MPVAYRVGWEVQVDAQADDLGLEHADVALQLIFQHHLLLDHACQQVVNVVLHGPHAIAPVVVREADSVPCVP